MDLKNFFIENETFRVLFEKATTESTDERGFKLRNELIERTIAGELRDQALQLLVADTIRSDSEWSMFCKLSGYTVGAQRYTNVEFG